MTALDVAPAVTQRWDPRKLSSLRAWYDAEYGQPRYVGYVQLDGGASDFIYTPDSPQVRITGAFDLVMRVRCTDWTAAGNQTLIGRYVTTTNLRSFRVFVDTSGRISVGVSSDGTSGALLTSLITPTVPLPDATWIWLRVTFLPDDGAGNRVASLFTAADTGSNGLLPTSWTANGADTDAGVASAHFAAATAPLEIGSFSSGAFERFVGRVGRVILRDGIDGPAAADFNADACYGPGYTQGLPIAADGSKYVQLYGRSPDSISCAESAALQITGDLELVGRIRMEDWTPDGANQILFGRFGTSNSTRGYALAVNSDGKLGYWWNNASGTIFNASTAAAPFVDRQTYWVKVTHDIDNGAGSREVKFWWAPDQPTEPTSWTQLGTTVTGAAEARNAGTLTPLIIGTGNSLTNYWAGRVHRAIVRNAIGGGVVADYNAQLADVDGQVDGYGNTWLHNNVKSQRWYIGLPKIYDRSGNNQPPATFGSGSNQPLWLPWDGEPDVYFPANLSSYLTTTRTMGTVNTSMQFVYCVDDMNATAAFAQPIGWAAALPGSGATAGMFVYHTPTRTPRVFFGSGGAPQDSADIGSAPPVGTRWWRVTWTFATGVILVERSYSLTNDPSRVVWVTHGSYTGSASGPFTRGADPLRVGEVPYVAANPLGGTLRRAQAYLDGVLQADLHPAILGQNGGTDSQGNVWTASRSATGGKLIIQSHAARSARSVILHGTDDWIDVPAAAIPPLDNHAAGLSGVAVAFRRWHNPGTTVLFTTKSTLNNNGLGYVLRTSSTAANDGLVTNVGDGTNGDIIIDNIAAPFGQRSVHTTTVIPSAGRNMEARTNGGVLAADGIRTTTVSASTGGAGRIGAYLGGSGAIDMEFETLILRDAGTTDTDHAQLVAASRGGL